MAKKLQHLQALEDVAREAFQKAEINFKKELIKEGMIPELTNPDEHFLLEIEPCEGGLLYKVLERSSNHED